jgi:hypothetical protein
MTTQSPHGRHPVPGGAKPTDPVASGHEVINRAPDDDADAAARAARPGGPRRTKRVQVSGPTRSTGLNF